MAGEEPDIISGPFWQTTKKALSIHHAGLIDVIAEAGFFNTIIGNQPLLMRKVNNVVAESNITEVVGFVSNYIEHKVPDKLGHGFKQKDLRNVFTRGIVNYINIPKLRLLPIKELKLHGDTKDKCYSYFKNCVVETSADKVALLKYEELVGCVWAKQVQPFNFTLLPSDAKAGQFETFCYRLANKDSLRYKSLQSIIGYMQHRYYIPSKAIIPCILDETITSASDEAHGGTGKTLLGLGLSYIRNVVVIDGKSFNANAPFPYQRVDRDTDIIFIDDLSRQTSFESFFSILSTGIEINQKGKPEFKIPREDTPKPFFTSNFPIRSVIGFSTERRKIEFEVGTYYNEKRSVRDDFGCEFFTDWGEAEYNAMFNFFVQCTQSYLREGIIKPPSINTELRNLISTVTIDLKEFLDDKIEQRIKKLNKRDLYAEFIKVNPGQRDYNRSQNKFIGRVHKYLAYMKASLKILDYRETPAATKINIEIIYPETLAQVENSQSQDTTGQGYKTISNVQHEYIVVDTKEKRAELISLLNSSHSFVFDTETAAGDSGTALDIHSLTLVGVSFAIKPGTAYYLPVPEEAIEAEEILKELRAVFENATIEKIGHNLKFDINVLRRYAIMVRGPLYDTMIAHYLYEPESPHGLKDVALELLQFQQTHIEELIGKGKDQLSMRDIPIHQITEYACQDADITFQLSAKLRELLKDRGVDSLLETDNKLIYVLADMEYTGIRVDYSVLGALIDEADPLLDKLSKEIYTIAGKEFNVNSSPQLGAVLFDHLGLPTVGKTKKGSPSTGKKDLAKLKTEHPIVALILEYKQTSSIKSSFLIGLPDKISPVTDRVHTQFKQARVATGRLSSSEPNLQNIPKGKEAGIGQYVRKAFIPSSSNHKIISGDYSQVELRVMAHISNDPVMVDAFNKGIDIHIATASRLFDIPFEEIKKNGTERKIAKTINFGLNYLMGAKGLADRMSNAIGKMVEVTEAEEYMERYFTEFAGVKRFHDEAYFSALEKGYAETLFGRRRYLPKLNSLLEHERASARRMAINAPIQGTSADIMRIAMVELHKQLNVAGLKSKILLSVHDEMVLDCPVTELDVVIPMTKRVMEQAVNLIVPLLVEIEAGTNWYEAH